MNDDIMFLESCRGRGRLVRGFNELFYEIKCSILVEIDIIFYFHRNCA